MASGLWGNPDTMNFQIRAKAQEFMTPGDNTVTIIVESNQASF